MITVNQERIEFKFVDQINRYPHGHFSVWHFKKYFLVNTTYFDFIREGPEGSFNLGRKNNRLQQKARRKK